MFLLSLFFAISALAYEVDQFTRRDEKPADSTDVLDQEIQGRIENAVKTANAKGAKCNTPKSSEDYEDSRRELFEELKNRLFASGPIGKLETFAIKKLTSKQRRNVNINDSVYQDAQSHSTILKKFGLAPVVTINGVQVGADKLGHLFDNGYDAYHIHYKDSDEETKYNGGLQQGIEDEKFQDGLTTTGVYSYGDLSADYAGQKFWETVCGWPNKDSKKQDLENFQKFRCKKNAYVFCDPISGDWKLNSEKKFTLKDYVTPAWDESINCSLYRSDMANDVFKGMNQKAFTYKGNPKQPCPAEPAKCLELKNDYPDYVRKIVISPLCKKIISAKQKGGDPIDPNEKFIYDFDKYDGADRRVEAPMDSKTYNKSNRQKVRTGN